MFCWRVQLFYKWNALSLPEQFLRSTWFVFSLCRLNSCLCSSNKFWFIHVFWWSWGRVFFRTFQQSGRYWSVSGVLTGLKGASGFPHCSLLLCGRGLPHLFSLSVDKSTTISYFVEVLSLRMLFLHHLRRFHTGQKIPQHLLTPGFYL